VTDPSDSKELVEAALKPWGWTCGPEFWERYATDPWVFNLVNALTRTTAESERLRHALTNVAENLHAAGLISDVARDNILRAVDLNTPATL